MTHPLPTILPPTPLIVISCCHVICCHCSNSCCYCSAQCCKMLPLVLRDCYQRTFVRCQRHCCCCTGSERHVICLQRTEDSMPLQTFGDFVVSWVLHFFMMSCVLKTTSFARNLHAQNTHMCSMNASARMCFAFCKFVSVALEMQHLQTPRLFGMWVESRKHFELLIERMPSLSIAIV